MKIIDIYEKYQIPINLQNHMIRTAAVGKIVVDLLVDQTIDEELVISTLLLHDMGNILKFDFEKMNMLDEKDRPRVFQLKEIQEKFRNKFGESADVATVAIMKEIGVLNRIVTLFEQSAWTHLEKTLESGTIEQKICYYSDMRVGPFGVISLDKRFNDLQIRYSKMKGSVLKNHALARILEKQLQSQVDINLDMITEETISPIKKKLMKFSVPIS